MVARPGLAPERADEDERNRHDDAVAERLDEAAGNPFSRHPAQPDEADAHLPHGRVGNHARDVGLQDREHPPTTIVRTPAATSVVAAQRDPSGKRPNDTRRRP